ncbi:MAG: prephenate dehydratase [Alistipes sp.]|nr:prephenate dehydratase [Alistipes sp.]
MRVAIQGYEGCFHEIVAREYFGGGITVVPCATFRQVAHEVESGKSDFGVMAIENSIAGSIISNYSILQNSRLQVAGEAYLRIEQNLMALPGTRLEDIEEVHSHPMALLQCVDFLDRHRWKLVETEDTALSARHIAERRLERTAGIAGRLAAELFGLEIIAPAINSIRHNYTRFMILKRHDHYIDPAADKASLYFKTDHRHGSLMGVLRQMEDSTINMTKLQSYPIPEEPWHYLFHVDMEFECLDDYIRTLDKLQVTAKELHVYGVYKRGNNTGIIQ